MGLEAESQSLPQTLIRGDRCVSSEEARAIAEDHGEIPLGRDEHARIWGHSALKGVELFRGCYRNYEFAPHFHTVPAIGIVDRGTMRAHWENSTYEVPAGGVILLNPGEVHAPGPLSEMGWSFRVFFLNNAEFQQRSLDVAGTTLRFARPFTEDRSLARALLQLHLELEGNASGLRAESTLLEVFRQLAQKHASAPAEVSDAGREHARISRAKQYIDAYYTRNISLADLASAAEISPFHMLRTFRREVGLTPHAYLTQVRVEEAKRLLRSGMAIAEVAGRTGFTDQSHLTRQFKRLTGVTPSRYLPSAS
jgi:AraC-like DNA-binding protein